MADGRQFILPLADEMIVDLFAGGGGMSVAIEKVFGRHADIACNHDDDALSMHRMNHPQTRHFKCDVFEVNPRTVCRGRKVGLLHLSPDCTHHSQAAGGQPRDRKIRALSWVASLWAGTVKPRVITLENVKQILKWGPLIAKRDPETGRVVTLEKVKHPVTGKMINRVAAPGEYVPYRNQFLVPDKRREGKTWARFNRVMEEHGYVGAVELLIAANHSAATTRERIMGTWRCDGLPIGIAETTHFRKPGRKQKRWIPAAKFLDFSIPCRSIFDRQKPLADATLTRIATGVKRYVIDAEDPFIVAGTHLGEQAPFAPHLQQFTQGGRNHSAQKPLPTITTANGGEQMVVTPTLLKIRGSSDGGRVIDPLPTLTSGAGAARPAGHPHSMGIISPILVQAAHGQGRPDGVKRWGAGSRDAAKPIGTFTGSGGHAIATANLIQFRQNCDGRPASEPLRTLSAGGEHHGIIECRLAQDVEESALRVAAFLIRYHGKGGQWADCRDPLTTLTTLERLALVTVTIRGTPYVIVDIGMRMLTPREAYGCQGFPASYIIERGHDGRIFSKSAQFKMCGNSVSPPMGEAHLRAQFPEVVSASARAA